MVLPHDIVDLQLAPVALAIDRELAALGRLPDDALTDQVLMAMNCRVKDLADSAERERILVSMVTRFVELHGWDVTCEERGIRMVHRDHSLVLGLPDSVRRFLAGVGQP